ncbi:MAG: porin [Phycisphaerales bacterium]|nr:porin [Phycisphaerales bacterium]
MAIRSLTCMFMAFCLVGRLQADDVPTPATEQSPQVEVASSAIGGESRCSTGCGQSLDCARTCPKCCKHRCDCRAFNVEGWLDAGFVLNGNKSPSGFNGPYNQTDRHEGSLNQAYLVFERPLARGPQMSLGGRVDMIYGTDAFLAESKGFERHPDGSMKWNGDHYGLALPQVYGQVGNEELSFKVGHFYTIVGYEGVPAVNNFFYTKSLSYMFAGPFVEWGGLATWKANQILSFDAGLVNGWDALDQVSDRAAFLGRVSLGNDQSTMWTSFAIIAGDELNELATDSTSRTRYSLIVGANLTSRIQYVFHHWCGVQDDFLASGDSAEWYGIDQYLYYKLTPSVRLGGRFEWFRDDDGVRLGLSRPSNPNKGPYIGDMYSFSLGVNWTPYSNVIVRPEVRWDWFEGSGLPFDDGTDDQQFLVGMDVIWRF